MEIGGQMTSRNRLKLVATPVTLLPQQEIEQEVPHEDQNAE